MLFVCRCCCVFYVDMLLSKQEGGNEKNQERGAKKWNNFRSKSNGAVMFPNVKSMVFLFFCFQMFVCVFLQKY